MYVLEDIYSRYFVGTRPQTMVSAACPSTNDPLGNGSMPRYFRGTLLILFVKIVISLKLAFAIKTYWVLNPLAVLAKARSLSRTAILTLPHDVSLATSSASSI